MHNTIQRHENNTKGAFFVNDKNFFGENPPTVDDIKAQIRQGDFTFISKLRYYSEGIRGSDGFWRKKTKELQAWIDFHISRNHGPPTHFITLTCAENWWPDLRQIYTDLEVIAESTNQWTGKQLQSNLLRNGNQSAMKKASRKHALYVNEYFMIRAKRFMDTFARTVMNLEYYWGRVEFASGRGAIHLHILGIAKDKAYLHAFHNAKTEELKVKAIQDYAEKYLEMTADVEIDNEHDKFAQNDVTSSPLGTRYCTCKNRNMDHKHLAQDTMLHDCNEYCLGQPDPKGKRCRSCRFGHGTEETPNKGDTPGKVLRQSAIIQKDRKGIEHLLLPRLHSRRITQHSKSLLQSWRANADIQLLIYRSNPNLPDVGEIEAVSRYCVSYAGKRSQTTQQEKIQSRIS